MVEPVSAIQTLNPLSVRTVPRLSTDRIGRADRIIHALDGLEAPVDGCLVADFTSRLWSLCEAQLGLAESPDFLLGLDSGGIIPCVGVSIASGIPYKIAGKLHIALEGAVHFIEPHSARRDMYAYAIAPGQRVFMIDDEITTGRTLANLANALRRAGADPVAAACLIEDTRHGGRDVMDGVGVPLVSLVQL